MLGDSAHDLLDWHDLLLATGGRDSRSVQSAKSDDPKDIDFVVAITNYEGGDDPDREKLTL
jgi:hypothetical protein